MRAEEIKGIIKSLWGAVFFYSGLFHLLRFYNNFTGRRLTILTYHRVTDKKIGQIEFSLPYLFVNSESFEKQLRFIKGHYRIISFRDLSGYLENNSLPWNSLIITFDDGYDDFYHTASPVMKKCAVPAAVFLTVERIGAGLGPFWWDRMYFYLSELSRRRSEGEPLVLDKETADLLKRFEENPSSFFNGMNKLETKKIEALLDGLQDKHGFSNERMLSENGMLDWGQVLEMDGYVEAGSHTCSHCNLLELDEAQLHHELKDSKRIIEKETGRKVTAFAYPAGNFNEKAKQAVKDSGYEFAVTTNPGINDLSDRYSIKRINVWEGTGGSLNGRLSKGFFASKLLGF